MSHDKSDFEKLIGPSVENAYEMLRNFVLFPWTIASWWRRPNNESGKKTVESNLDEGKRTFFKDENRDWDWVRVWLAVLLVVVVVFVVLGLGPHFLVWLFKGEWPTEPEKFGDSFGFVNAFLSALALAAVIVAIFMQREDLRMQREDLLIQKEQRDIQIDEMRKTVNVQDAQAKAGLAASFVNAIATTNELQASGTASDRHQLLADLAELQIAVLAEDSLPLFTRAYRDTLLTRLSDVRRSIDSRLSEIQEQNIPRDEMVSRLREDTLKAERIGILAEPFSEEAYRYVRDIALDIVDDIKLWTNDQLNEKVSSLILELDELADELLSIVL